MMILRGWCQDWRGMIRKILESFIFKITLVCIVGALVFLGIGYAIEALGGKIPTELYMA